MKLPDPEQFFREHSDWTHDSDPANYQVWLDILRPVMVAYGLECADLARAPLEQAAMDFVAWADDCWGSQAINNETTAKADYEAAKQALADKPTI